MCTWVFVSCYITWGGCLGIRAQPHFGLKFLVSFILPINVSLCELKALFAIISKWIYYVQKWPKQKLKG